MSQLQQLANTQLRPFTGSFIHQSDTCWCCLRRGSLELHHLVPRSYGGTDGPQVSLCGNCHTGIHELSFIVPMFTTALTLDLDVLLKMIWEHSKTWLQLPPSQDKKEQTLIRAWALGNVVFKARLLFKGTDEPNKTVVFQTTFSGEEAHMLKVLTKLFGRNQELTVKQVLREAYRNHIGTLDK